MKTINRQQKTVLVKRHLVDEAGLLQCLKQICDEFTELVESTQLEKIGAQQMKPLEDQLEDFTVQAHGVQQKRTRLLEFINQGRSPDDPLTVRHFIGDAAESDRDEMERMRTDLIDVTTEIQAAMTGNGAIVYYSYDFFRELMSRFGDRSAQEASYDATGKTDGLQVGNLFGKAC